ncbi:MULTISPECIES: DUF1801 domain-containing protein [Asticcacaulis]|uniref:DUF1801 domain-containing protein n=1 Tax=Asticcacaulis TaxID=76890 RepID=UPI001AE9A39C|nr:MULTISPECIES: DUF1801 domain-containing protein [Asticcacaulis]MBP2161828.1 hypothetical protein [Asticcacaulis solisilvae]MDR6802874.1 hypothetical protein [Asticcacaulis sp. BE141]
MSSVDDFIVALVSPRKAEIEAVRQIILASHPEISEGIKWNAPSFFYKDWFATFHLRAKSGIQIILHRGAKIKTAPMREIADPSGLLEWLAPDRATMRFADIDAIEARRGDLSSVIRAWISAL